MKTYNIWLCMEEIDIENDEKGKDVYAEKIFSSEDKELVENEFGNILRDKKFS